MNTQSDAESREVARRENGARRSEFYLRYDLLLANWYVLTDRLQQEILALRQDLHEDLARWRPRQREPVWNAYADRVNLICQQVGIQPASSGPGGSATTRQRAAPRLLACLDLT